MYDSTTQGRSAHQQKEAAQELSYLAVEARSRATRLSSEMSNRELHSSQSSLKGPENHFAPHVDSPMAT